MELIRSRVTLFSKVIPAPSPEEKQKWINPALIAD